MAIVRATNTTVLRGHGQFAADAVALAYADHGAEKAQLLALAIGVTITSASTDARGNVTVDVQGNRFWATSTAG